MSDDAPLHEESESAPSSGPGNRLRAKREELGWPLEQIGQELRVLPSILRALEEDRFDVLEAPIFVRGHLRNYARLLGLPPEEIVAEYEATRPSDSHPSLQLDRTTGPAMDGGTPGWVFTLAWLGLFALLVLGALWWYAGPHRAPIMESPEAVSEAESGRSAGSDESAADEAGEEDDVIDLADVADESDEESVAEEPAMEPVEDEAAGNSEEAPADGDDATGITMETPPALPVEDVIDASDETGQDEASPTEDDASPPPLAEAEADRVRELTLVLSEDSWLEIYDDQDRQLYYGLASEGEELKLRGEAPISLFMGNAPAVSMSVDGREHDFSGRIRRDNTARVTIRPAAESEDAEPDVSGGR